MVQYPVKKLSLRSLYKIYRGVYEIINFFCVKMQNKPDKQRVHSSQRAQDFPSRHLLLVDERRAKSSPPSSPPPLLTISTLSLFSSIDLSFIPHCCQASHCSMFTNVAPNRETDMEDDDAVMGGGSGKKRMRWTPELRECFERAVDHLGGPDRATPKGILKTMSVPALTIAHVKSYLQKYRMSKFIPESSDGGKLESRKLSEILPNFSSTSRVQITEALQSHMEGQLGLDDQLEVQKHLKLRTDLQGRYLEKITHHEQYDFSGNRRTEKHHSPRKLNPFWKMVGQKRSEKENCAAMNSFSGISSSTENVQISNKRLRMTNHTHQKNQLMEECFRSGGLTPQHECDIASEGQRRSSQDF